MEPSTPSLLRPPPGAASGFWRGWWVVVLLAAACLPGLILAWQAGGPEFLSDDSAALGWVDRNGPFADWTRPEYDLRTVLFWRPLVTTTLGLQLLLAGPSPWFFFSFNLACHAFSVWLCASVARRMAGKRSSAAWAGLVAGLWLATFPHLGGNLAWSVGRVDAQCLVLMLAALWAAVAGRRGLELVCALAALATKEQALALPLWLWLVRVGGGQTAWAAARAAAPAWLALGCGLLARRWALGVWVGGYPLAPLGPEQLLRALAGFGSEQLPGLLALAAACACAWVARTGAARAGAAGLLLALSAALPLVHLLAQGSIAAEHQRTLYATDAGLGLGLALVAAPLLGSSRRWWRAGVALALSALMGQRAWEAAEDYRSWFAAAAEVRAIEAEVRTELARLPSSPVPVAAFDLPRERDGAYLLHWGVADRFRAPFAAAGRPVWPWREVFGERSLPFETAVSASGRLQPLVGTAVAGASLGLWVRDTRPSEPLGAGRVDERLFGEDLAGQPWLELRGADSAAQLELVLFTELGYESAAVQRAALEPQAAGVGLLSLKRALELPATSSGVLLWQVLGQSADIGAREAWLQLRLLREGQPTLASAWVCLRWDQALRDRIYPR